MAQRATVEKAADKVVVEAVGTATGTSTATATANAVLSERGLLLLHAAAAQQRGRQQANQIRRNEAATDHAQWRAWRDEELRKSPRPSNAEIIGRIAKRAGKAKSTIRKRVPLPDR